ncbi:MAG: DsbC family protein [Gammaproteobacteria bacterium]|nr:DsbC family protein [Gammaproteobacteria bacterium]
MKPIKLYLSAGLLSCMSLAFAAENAPAPDVDITQLLKSRLGDAEVSVAQKTPAEGIYQTSFGSKIAYLTGDGRFVIVGDMIDLQTQVNLTELSRRTVSKNAIDKFATSDLAIFPSMKETTAAVLNIFTDSSCPYCKKLHEEVPELQKAGIEVRYFPFPRGGNRGPGYQTLKQVWCAEDRAAGMDIAKETAVGELPPGTCENAKIVDRGYLLGNEVGVTGTPALFTENGKKIDGYVPYQNLIPMVLN